MIDLIKSETFDDWLLGLRDVRAKAKILLRLDRLRLGNPGDVKPVGEGISEMRIDYGPGYRIYFTQKGRTLLILLCGDDKDTQDRDIRLAKSIAADWRN